MFAPCNFYDHTLTLSWYLRACEAAKTLAKLNGTEPTSERGDRQDTAKGKRMRSHCRLNVSRSELGLTSLFKLREGKFSEFLHVQVNSIEEYKSHGQ